MTVLNQTKPVNTEKSLLWSLQYRVGDRKEAKSTDKMMMMTMVTMDLMKWKEKRTDTGANERMHTVSETNKKKKTYGRSSWWSSGSTWCFSLPARPEVTN